MYYLDDDRTIVFKEKNTGDIVDIHFNLKKGETGFFSEEYKGTKWEQSKKVDITCGVLNIKEKRIRFKLYDVKNRLHAEEMILKFYQQLHDGYRAFREDVLKSYIDFAQDKELGAITTYFDKNELNKRINALQKRIETIEKMEDKTNQPIGKIKAMQNQTKEKQILDVMVELSNLKFDYRDDDYEERFDVTIRMMDTDDSGAGHGYMEV